jgi:hypothetical protein
MTRIIILINLIFIIIFLVWPRLLVVFRSVPFERITDGNPKILLGKNNNNTTTIYCTVKKNLR